MGKVSKIVTIGFIIALLIAFFLSAPDKVVFTLIGIVFGQGLLNLIIGLCEGIDETNHKN